VITPTWHHLPENPYNPHAWIVGEPDIGDGCWIGAFTVIDGSGGLTIGNGCDISAGVQIYSHSTVQRVLSERTMDIERASTVIGEYTHVGANAIILMGSEIGHHCIVAASALVPQFTVVPPWSVVVGVPARVEIGAARRYGKEDDPR